MILSLSELSSLLRIPGEQVRNQALVRRVEILAQLSGEVLGEAVSTGLYAPPSPLTAAEGQRITRCPALPCARCTRSRRGSTADGPTRLSRLAAHVRVAVVAQPLDERENRQCMPAKGGEGLDCFRAYNGLGITQQWADEAGECRIRTRVGPLDQCTIIRNATLATSQGEERHQGEAA